MRIILGFHF